MKYCKKFVVLPEDTYTRLLRKTSKDTDEAICDEQIKRPDADHILTFIPRNARLKAAAILAVFDHDILSWNSQLELICDKRVVQGSNIVDLLRSVTYKYKDFAPLGLNEFLSGLSKLNCPQSLLSYSRRSAYVNASQKHRDTKWIEF